MRFATENRLALPQQRMVVHQSIVLNFFTYYAQILTYYAGIIPLCF